METRSFPIGKVVWNHKTKETLINLKEIEECVSQWKKPEEVNRIINDVQSHTCTILLYKDVWLFTELR